MRNARLSCFLMGLDFCFKTDPANFTSRLMMLTVGAKYELSVVGGRGCQAISPALLSNGSVIKHAIAPAQCIYRA
jgi:hypothetical protein